HRLVELGLVVKEERPYLHAVGHCYRCHTEIEPWLSGKQWSVAVERLKGPARRAAADGRVRVTPDRWGRAYDEWLAGLRGWNISRQLWWGHRIPVWYCPDGHEFAALEDPAGCAECGRTDIEQDPDVLDTWFSSQLWPFSTLGWPDATEDLGSFYPTSVLVTGYEILYLWVARMIMSGLYLVGDVPFRQVVIHGLVRDRTGRKMSKSLGNVIDPLDMIERYGADALRFALARMASPEQQNLPLAEESIEAGRNFANKIWNAARLVLRAYPGGAPELPPPERWTFTERWLLSRHQACVSEVESALADDRFDAAAQAIHRFLWSELCDWGLEMEKGRLYEGTPEERHDAAHVLAWVLERTLRLLHPIMPFVTEEIWQRFGVGESIVIAPWPEGHPGHADPETDASFAFVQELVTEIRSLQTGIPRELRGHIDLDESVRAVVEPFLEDLQRVGGTPVTFAHLEGARARLAMADGIDVGPILEQKRRKLEAVRDKLERKRRKLENEGFLAKAEPEVVEGERRGVAELEEEEGRLLAELDQLGGAGA
ncbi:MAG: class I tRNA ligase family protein, partial [Actinobacteria bacterium]|nr:class I tRNA ligase family protein [Actinomycetota bacterium]